MSTTQDTEKRPGDLRQDTNRTATKSDTYEEASAMSNSTAHDPAEGWHPEWCSKNEDIIAEAEQYHYSHAEVLERSPGLACGPDSGEGFRVELKRVLSFESGVEYMDEWDVVGDLTIESEAFDEKVNLIIGTNKLRDLADFLFTEADRIDAWHKAQQEKFGGDSGE